MTRRLGSRRATCTAASKRKSPWTASICGSRPERSTGLSGQMVPARRRRCGCSLASSIPRRVGSASWERTRLERTRRFARTSVTCRSSTASTAISPSPKTWPSFERCTACRVQRSQNVGIDCSPSPAWPNSRAGARRPSPGGCTRSSLCRAHSFTSRRCSCSTSLRTASIR